MTRSILLLSVLVAIAGCTYLEGPVPDNGAGQKPGVDLSAYPTPVQDALRTHAAGGTIKEIDKETKNGKIVYEAEVLMAGKLYEITVGEDGSFLGKELEDDDDDGDDDDDDDDDD